MTILNKETHSTFLGFAVTTKALYLLVFGWLFLSTIQTVHFYWYFEQTLWNSIRWSFRDWFVWFVIFGCLFTVFTHHTRYIKFSISNLLIVGAIAITSGFLQTFIVVSLDYIMGNPSRPFWDDFWRFYSKRWLQHLFVFSIFWLLMINRTFVRNSAVIARRETVQEPNIRRIQINDGKNMQWIEHEAIFCIEAAGNYLCFHTMQGQLISRGSLKELEEQLDNALFIRVSRSNIVNVNKIVSSQRVSRSKVELALSNEQRVTIGPTYWRAIKNRLKL